MYIIIIKLVTIINWELIDVSSDLLTQSDKRTFSRIISEWNTLPESIAMSTNTLIPPKVVSPLYWVVLRYLTPLSTIFQSFNGGQIYWWKSLL